MSCRISHLIDLTSTALCSISIATLLNAAVSGISSGQASVESNDGILGAVVHKAPEEGGPRRFQIASDSAPYVYDKPSADASPITVAEDGAVLFNLGCQRVEEHVWCHVQPLMGGPKGYVSAEYLVPAIGPDGTVPRGTDDSARRARKGDFDAQEVVPCAQEDGQALGVCSARVARSDGGDATVIVAFPNGFARSLYFMHGHFVSADATMSGAGTDTDWQLKDGLHVLRVDDQQYVIPNDLLVDQSPKSR